MSTYFLKSGNHFRVSSEAALDLYKSLPVGNYIVKYDPNSGFYLETLEEFSIPTKIYGSTKQASNRILKTFDSRHGSTGVLLCGSKGSGKTLLAKLISDTGAKQGIPTIIVSSPFGGDNFNTFISAITQKCILLFDEFEKTYNMKLGEQKPLLTLLDGVCTGKKLFVMTANNAYAIDDHMINRPGRFFYYMKFNGVDLDFIRQYCADNLTDLSHTEEICILSTLFEEFNFDMLQAMVEEINRYGEAPSDVVEFLNVKPNLGVNGEYDVSVTVDGRAIPNENLSDEDFNGSPLIGGVEVSFVTDRGTDDEKWNTIKFSTSHITVYDAQKGVVKFKNEKGDLTLNKKVVKQLGYRDLMAL